MIRWRVVAERGGERFTVSILHDRLLAYRKADQWRTKQHQQGRRFRVWVQRERAI